MFKGAGVPRYVTRYAVALRRVAIVLGIPLRRILALLLAPVQGTLAMAVVVLLVAHAAALAAAAPALRLAVEATAGALTYAAVLYWLEPACCREAGLLTKGGLCPASPRGKSRVEALPPAR